MTNASGYPLIAPKAADSGEGTTNMKAKELASFVAIFHLKRGKGFNFEMQGKWKISAVVAAACLTMAAQCGYAQSVPNNAATGRNLAEQLCSQCHVVVPSGQPGWTDAPAFDAIANGQGATAAKLSAFIQKPHMHMLNTGRPQGEADAIAAYIISLHKN